MNNGKIYKTVPFVYECSKCGTKKGEKEMQFPFNEKLGIFCGTTKEGWLIFRLSGQRECIMNGGYYEEVKANIELNKL